MGSKEEESLKSRGRSTGLIGSKQCKFPHRFLLLSPHYLRLPSTVEDNVLNPAPHPNVNWEQEVNARLARFHHYYDVLELVRLLSGTIIVHE